jgi:hypothetical protein
MVHPPVEPSFAFRFDTPERSIVISGDTARSEGLITLAKDADVLVHEALSVPQPCHSSVQASRRVRIRENPGQYTLPPTVTGAVTLATALAATAVPIDAFMVAVKSPAVAALVRFVTVVIVPAVSGG